MAVITISITESPVQVVAGIPKSVSIDVNVPATIFYTLDGTDPTVNSEIYVSAITLPTVEPSVTLKVFATDGVDTSAIVTRTYGNTTFSSARRPRDMVTVNSNYLTGYNLEPFSSVSPSPQIIYGNTAGLTVDSPTIVNIPDGYDGTGTGTYANGTDQPLSSYQFVYSETNSIGERGDNIGTLPAKVRVVVPPPPPAYSETSDKLFNPKALVILQDGREPPEDPSIPLTNRPYFFLENAETARDGSYYNLTAFEGATPTGSFLRQHYNPREQTITYYYFDSRSLRWIISKEPYTPNKTDIFSLDKVVLPSRRSKHVYKWIPFKRKHLM